MLAARARRRSRPPQRLPERLPSPASSHPPPDDLAPADGSTSRSAGCAPPTGALGRFEVTVDGYAAADPAGRGAVAFGPAVGRRPLAAAT